jgi:hypothetical protein
MIVALTVQAQTTTTIIKNKPLRNDTSYTSDEINVGAFKQSSVFVSWNDTINAVVFTAYKPAPEAQWAIYQSDTIHYDTLGGKGIALKSSSVDHIPAGSILNFTIELQSTGNTSTSGKVINVFFLKE